MYILYRLIHSLPQPEVYSSNETSSTLLPKVNNSLSLLKGRQNLQ